MGMEKLLSLDKINKWYNGLHALQNVSLDINCVEIVALVGAETDS